MNFIIEFFLIKTFKPKIYYLIMEEEKKKSLFLISITGKNIHFEVPINTLKDFEDVDNIMKTLKKKL